MSTRDDLHRLAEARPAILGQTHLVMDAAQEERVLAQILRSPGPAARKSRRQAARLPRRPAIIATLAAAVAAGVAATATLVAVNTGLPGARGPAAGSPGHLGAPGTGTGHPPASSTPVIDVDTLTQRTALAVSAASKDIEYTKVTYAAGTAGKVATLQLWTYGKLTREYAATADGSPDTRMSGVVVGGIRYRRFIDYASRTWQEDSIPASEFGQLPADWITTAVRRMINGASGSARAHHDPQAETVIRAGTLPGGERVITATGKPWTYRGADGATPVGGGAPVAPAVPLPELASPEFIPSQSGPPLTVHTTVVIDASTYLPLQVTLTTTDGRVIESQSFSWLPPTAANLTPLKAQVPVPAGFTQAG